MDENKVNLPKNQKILSILFNDDIPLEKRKKLMILIAKNKFISSAEEEERIIKEFEKEEESPEPEEKENGARKSTIICMNVENPPKILCRNCNKDQTARLFLKHIVSCYNLPNPDSPKKRYLDY